MILNSYGNYVIQKIFSCSSSSLKSTLLEWIEKDFINIVKTKAGTHSLQSIVCLLDLDNLQKIYQIIDGVEVDISNDEFGTHFMQMLVEHNINYDFITKILNNFTEIACNKYGIVVLKKIMKLTGVDFNIRYYLLQVCQNNFNEVSDTEYGHYIIEELFLYYNEHELQTIL